MQSQDLSQHLDEMIGAGVLCFFLFADQSVVVIDHCNRIQTMRETSYTPQMKPFEITPR